MSVSTVTSMILLKKLYFFFFKVYFVACLIICCVSHLAITPCAAVLEGMSQVRQAAESAPATVPHHAGVASEGIVAVVVYTHPTSYQATAAPNVKSLTCLDAFRVQSLTAGCLPQCFEREHTLPLPPPKFCSQNEVKNM